MQKNFAYNMTALVPGEDGHTMVPKDGLSLKDILQHFLDFRLVTVRRRFEFELRKLRARIHILEGFRIIFNALDRAIKLIRESNGKADAADKLKAEFKLDDDQATAILDVQLYKIAKLEINKILDELKEKKARAAEIETLLASKKKLWTVVRGELEKLAEEFPERRKTRMASEDDVLEFDEQAYIVKENANVVLTRDGWVKRVGRLTSVENTRVREGDSVLAVAPGSTLDTVVFFADDGTAYTMRINEVPASSGYGEPISKFFKLADGVRIVATVTTDPRFTAADTAKGPYLLVATSAGNVLRQPLTSFRPESTKAGRRYVKLDDGDKVVTAQLITGEESVMLASRQGYIIHFKLDEVNILSGAGKGVAGIKLGDDDVCIGGVLIGGSRFDAIEVEQSNGKTARYGREARRLVGRGGKGDEVVKRLTHTRIVPPPIELVNWDEIEGKPTKGKG